MSVRTMNIKQLLIIAILAVLAIQVFSKEAKTLYTNGYYYSQYFPLEENLAAEKVLRFSVRAASDAHILLAPSHQADGPVYEIVLGAQANTVNYIRGRCPCQTDPSTTIRIVNLLNKNEFRNFWIKIKSDVRRAYIQVGMGGSDAPFQEWRDPKPLNLQFLSFRSGSVAEWKFGYSDEANTLGVSDDQRKTVVASTGFGQYFPLSEVVCHYDDSVVLYFTVRSSKEFQIIFSPEVSSVNDLYEVGLNQRGTYIRRRHLGKAEETYEQDGFFLNERERLKFWIKIAHDGRVKLGIGGSNKHLVQWRDPNPLSPQFVSFSLFQNLGVDSDSSSSADLQYGLGPDYTLATQACRPQWKQASNQLLPLGAVRGGRNNENEIFICRAKHRGDDIPGSFIPGRNGRGDCLISSGLLVYNKTEFSVLVGCRFTWVSASLGTVPKGAIVAGNSVDTGKTYVARVAHEGQVIVGRLRPDHRLIYIAFNNQELPFTNYEVLVNPSPVRATPGTQQPDTPPPLIGK